MFSSMDGRSVVVTGGSRGIGRGIARVFATAGARVLITGRDETALGEAVDELKAAGEVSTFAGDVADRAQCDAMAAAAVEQHGASTSSAPTPASSPRPPSRR
jgi:3-oxoacyl-[acyl-carrier protein] reductase